MRAIDTNVLVRLLTADALHLARSSHCSAFVTFDRKFAKRAKSLPSIPVMAP